MQPQIRTFEQQVSSAIIWRLFSPDRREQKPAVSNILLQRLVNSFDQNFLIQRGPPSCAAPPPRRVAPSPWRKRMLFERLPRDSAPSTPFSPDAVVSVRPPVPGICRWDSLQHCSLDPVQRVSGFARRRHRRRDRVRLFVRRVRCHHALRHVDPSAGDVGLFI